MVDSLLLVLSDSLDYCCKCGGGGGGGGGVRGGGEVVTIVFKGKLP